MTETSKTEISKTWTLRADVRYALTLAALLSLLAMLLGIRGWIRYERDQEMVCRSNGGIMITLSQATGCFRITAEPVEVK